jgi:hypothetical protein
MWDNAISGRSLRPNLSVLQHQQRSLKMFFDPFCPCRYYHRFSISRILSHAGNKKYGIKSPLCNMRRFYLIGELRHNCPKKVKSWVGDTDNSKGGCKRK